MVVGFLSIITLMRVLQSVFNKKASVQIPDGITPYIKYISVSKYLAAGFALLLIFLQGEFSGANPQAVGIAACSGMFLAINSVCGIKALKSGTIALSSMFSTAGLVVPCILGSIFLNEPVSAIQVICILILFLSTLLLIKSTKGITEGFSGKTVIYLIGNLISNGMVMFCQKMFGILQPDGNVSLFSMLTFLIPAVVLTLFIPFTSKRESEKKSLPKGLIFYAIILAFAVFVIQQLVTLLTPVLSSAVLFTFVNGGATVIAAIVGAVMYKEKLTVKSIFGIILGIASMVCIKLF